LSKGFADGLAPFTLGSAANTKRSNFGVESDTKAKDLLGKSAKSECSVRGNLQNEPPIFPTHITAREWIAAIIAGFVIWVISDFWSYVQVIDTGKG
jgi:hypothetical protein